MLGRMVTTSAIYYDRHLFFDKAVISMIGTIGGLFLLVKGYWIEQQGLAMRLKKEGGEATVLLRDQLTF